MKQWKQAVIAVAVLLITVGYLYAGLQDIWSFPEKPLLVPVAAEAKRIGPNAPENSTGNPTAEKGNIYYELALSMQNRSSLDYDYFQCDEMRMFGEYPEEDTSVFYYAGLRYYKKMLEEHYPNVDREYLIPAGQTAQFTVLIEVPEKAEQLTIEHWNFSEGKDSLTIDLPRSGEQ